jgi:hypothetical protein
VAIGVFHLGLYHGFRPFSAILSTRDFFSFWEMYFFFSLTEENSETFGVVIAVFTHNIKNCKQHSNSFCIPLIRRPIQRAQYTKMNMERSITFLLYCLFMAVAMADEKPLVRKRRGLYNVKKEANVKGSAREFGFGDRELQEEIEVIMADTMSMSMSYSYDYGYYESTSSSRKGKGKSKSRR